MGADYSVSSDRQTILSDLGLMGVEGYRVASPFFSPEFEGFFQNPRFCTAKVQAASFLTERKTKKHESIITVRVIERSIRKIVDQFMDNFVTDLWELTILRVLMSQAPNGHLDGLNSTLLHLFPGEDKINSGTLYLRNQVAKLFAETCLGIKQSGLNDNQIQMFEGAVFYKKNGRQFIVLHVLDIIESGIGMDSFSTDFLSECFHNEYQYSLLTRFLENVYDCNRDYVLNMELYINTLFQQCKDKIIHLLKTFIRPVYDEPGGLPQENSQVGMFSVSSEELESFSRWFHHAPGSSTHTQWSAVFCSSAYLKKGCTFDTLNVQCIKVPKYKYVTLAEKSMNRQTIFENDTLEHLDQLKRVAEKPENVYSTFVHDHKHSTTLECYLTLSNSRIPEITFPCKFDLQYKRTESAPKGLNRIGERVVDVSGLRAWLETQHMKWGLDWLSSDIITEEYVDPTKSEINFIQHKAAESMVSIVKQLKATPKTPNPKVLSDWCFENRRAIKMAININDEHKPNVPQKALQDISTLQSGSKIIQAMILSSICPHQVSHSIFNSPEIEHVMSLYAKREHDIAMHSVATFIFARMIAFLQLRVHTSWIRTSTNVRKGVIQKILNFDNVDITKELSKHINSAVSTQKTVHRDFRLSEIGLLAQLSCSEPVLELRFIQEFARRTANIMYWLTLKFPRQDPHSVLKIYEMVDCVKSWYAPELVLEGEIPAVFTCWTKTFNSIYFASNSRVKTNLKLRSLFTSFSEDSIILFDKDEDVDNETELGFAKHFKFLNLIKIGTFSIDSLIRIIEAEKDKATTFSGPKKSFESLYLTESLNLQASMNLEIIFWAYSSEGNECEFTSKINATLTLVNLSEGPYFNVETSALFTPQIAPITSEEMDVFIKSVIVTFNINMNGNNIYVNSTLNMGPTDGSYELKFEPDTTKASWMLRVPWQPKRSSTCTDEDVLKENLSSILNACLIFMYSFGIQDTSKQCSYISNIDNYHSGHNHIVFDSCYQEGVILGGGGGGGGGGGDGMARGV